VPTARFVPFPPLRLVSGVTAARTRAVLRRLAPDGYGPKTLALGTPWTTLLGGESWVVPEALTLGSTRALAATYGDTTLAAVFTLPHGEALVALIDRPLAFAVIAQILGEPVSLLGALSARHEGTLLAWVARVATAASHPAPPPIVRGITDTPAEALEALGSPGRVARDDLVVWPWRVTAGAWAGRVTLCLHTRALGPEGAAGVPHGAVGETLGAVGVWGRWVLARAALSAREVAALGVGDVLLTEGLLATKEGWVGPGSLCFGGTMALPFARRHDDTVVLTGPAAPPQRLDMNPDNDHPAFAPAALGELPVEVTVDLGQTAFPLHEVARWRVGEVLTFPQRADARVTVRAGGRVVARGELVDVDGHVGVSLTEVLR